MEKFFRPVAHIAALVASLLAAGQASAQAVVSSGQSFVTARLLPGKSMPDGSRMAGLRLTLEPEWKTYWRTPGQAGIPPTLDWSASRNLASVEVLWPRPETFYSFGMKTVGYGGTVVLPVRVRSMDASLPVSLSLTADLGVCKDICVLERFSIGEEIAPNQRSIGWQQISRSIEAVPLPADQLGVRLTECQVKGHGDERQLYAMISGSFSGGDVLVEGSDALWVMETEVVRTDEGLAVTAALALPESITWVDRSALRFTVLADTLAADIQGCIVGPD